MGREGRGEGSATLERVFALAVACGALLVIAYAAWRVRATYVGDAAVYLAYAKNAADGRLFQFNPGEFSSGSTSPLWALLLAAPHLVGASLGGVKVLSALAAMCGLLATMLAGRRVSGSWSGAAVGALFVLGTMTFPAIAMYESGLVVTLSALALVVGDRFARSSRAGDAPDRRVQVALVAVWAALPLTRPDAVVLVLAHVVALAAFAPGGSRTALRTLLPMLAVAAVPAAAYFGYSLAELGTFSTSSQARAFALREVADTWIGPLYLQTDTLRELLRSPWIFGVLGLIAGLTLLFRGERRWIAVYGGMVFAGYVVLLTCVTPGYWDSARYLLPLVPVVAVAIAVVVALPRRPHVRWLAAALGALVIGGSAVHELRGQVGYARAIGITEHEVFERDVSDRIEQLAQPGDSVLAYEVQLRYFLRDDVTVISQDGITDPRVAPYRPTGDMTGLLRRYRPRFWIADRNVEVRRYLGGSVLDRARTAFQADPIGTTRMLDGVRFELIARRDRPLALGFGGWEMLFELSYPEDG